MGHYGARIGKYWMSFPDYNLANLRQQTSKKDYFDKRKVEVSFVQLKDGDNERTEETIKYSLTQVIPSKKDHETNKYTLNWPRFDLQKTLYDELVKRKIELYVNPHVHVPKYNDEKYNAVVYYLTSRLHGKIITLQSIKPVPYKITSYEDILWLDKNGLRYD